MVREHPLWAGYLSMVKGVGPRIAAYLIVKLNPARFKTVSALYKYCYDEETEVLTSEGFKRFPELRGDELIATLNENGELVYERPIKFYKIPYSGEVIYFEGRDYNLLVTPEHLMYVRRWRHDSFELIPAYEIYEDWHPGKYELKRDAKWMGQDVEYVELPRVWQWKVVEKIPIDLFLELFGWYITEGYCDRHGRKRLPRVEIGQSRAKNPENVDRIIEVIKRLGFSPYVKVDPDGMCHIEVHSTQLYEYFKQFGKSRERYIPQWIKNLPPHRLRLLVDVMLRGDGDRYYHPRFFTTSKRLADDFQEIVLKAGWTASVVQRKDGIYAVTVIKRELTPAITVEPKVMYYSGYVYDVTMPNNHIILVRRNGKIMWSSNCGLHVVDGRAPRRRAGEKTDWNPEARTMAWRLGESFRLKGGFYKMKYHDFLNESRAKHPGWTAGHVAADARRRTVKLFLSHWMYVGRRILGLEPVLPYSCVKDPGLHHCIPPVLDKGGPKEKEMFYDAYLSAHFKREEYNYWNEMLEKWLGGRKAGGEEEEEEEA
jgi:hypothetical protein